MQIIQGDCCQVLQTLPDETIDLIVTDPPYGVSFMGKNWDKAVPSVEVWRECLRVLKPGAFAFVMSLPRQDVLSRMIVNLEDAGFQTGFTSIYWTFASGFPKAQNIGKVVDKKLGAKRTEKVWKDRYYDGHTRKELGSDHMSITTDLGYKNNGNFDYLIPATSQAKALDGSYAGFQPKPAVEVILVVMRPLSEKTYVDQAMNNGKGCTWLDECRIPYKSEADKSEATPQGRCTSKATVVGAEPDAGRNLSRVGFERPELEGRFPANLLVSDDILDGYSKFFSLDKWAETYPFLLVPKASKKEKNRGCEGLPEKQLKGGGGTNNTPDDVCGKYGSIKAPKQNHHPTVKPLKLMSYLITLGSREGDTVLDPFVGSGTTAVAAKMLGRNCIGIESDPENCEIATKRTAAAKVKEKSLFGAV